MEIEESLRGKVGLGFRFGLAKAMLALQDTPIEFVEIGPENYVGTGGRRKRLIDEAKEKWPVVCHGLSGDLAGLAPIDHALLGEMRDFLHGVGAHWYSDHLCMTHIAGTEIHELVAMPFTYESVRRTAARVKAVSEILELPMAIENVSAYGHMPGKEMSEPEFVGAVLEEADCPLLLDINNVYVNAVNFGFEPRAYIDALPLERVIQLHMAGHFKEADDLLLDTHAMPIIDPVYELFEYAYAQMPHQPPVLLERDGNFPELSELEAEITRIATIVEKVHANA